MNCAPPPPPVPPPPPPVAAPAPAPLPDAAEPYVRRQPTQPMGATLLAPLHTLEPRYEAMVCDLLAQRWPKSDEARLASLRESCDAFPTHLVLVDVARACAAGVASLSRTVEDAQALLVENVLVDELWRGTGLGRTLMEAVHEVRCVEERGGAKHAGPRQPHSLLSSTRAHGASLACS